MGFCVRHLTTTKTKCFKCEEEIRKHIEKQYEAKFTAEDRSKLEILWNYARLKYGTK